MPSIWLWVSGVFFALGIVVCTMLTILLTRVMGTLRAVEPQLRSSADRLEAATKKLEATAKSAQKTVDHVGTKARNVADGIETVALVSAQRLHVLATIVTSLSTLFKLVNLVKAAKAEKQAVDKKALMSHNRHSDRGVEQPGSSSGS